MSNYSGVNYIETEETCYMLNASVVEPCRVQDLWKSSFDIEDPTKASNSQHRIFRILCSTPLPFNMNRTTANEDRQVTTTACTDDEGAMLCNNDPVTNANLWIDGNIS
ncbi:hypothetical protein CEXT_710121 [Caerostris extrusa]|uniref:Uncharacterized protein n=1 Tax=Caerostris extrusa TaxID=172846 RepID=A0AAV4VUG1_CAEEX|nr:hypothetical protein CEXT_710121 [Caerostris extrusa]